MRMGASSAFKRGLIKIKLQYMLILYFNPPLVPLQHSFWTPAQYWVALCAVRREILQPFLKQKI